MKSFIIWHAAAATLIQGAVQHDTRSASPLLGYGVDDMQWSFKPPFSDPIFLNGTIQDIMQKLEHTDIVSTDSHAQNLRSMIHWQERSDAKDAISVKFCGTFPMANSHHTSAQVPAIVATSGPAVIGPGPGNCAQVSCAQGSAIWWCNDDESTIVLPQGTEQLGDAVGAIITQCCVATQCRVSPGFPISGQAFSDEGWNVLVRGEEC